MRKARCTLPAIIHVPSVGPRPNTSFACAGNASDQLQQVKRVFGLMIPDVLCRLEYVFFRARP